jgi:hypothetical protein
MERSRSGQQYHAWAIDFRNCADIGNHNDFAFPQYLACRLLEGALSFAVGLPFCVLPIIEPG